MKIFEHDPVESKNSKPFLMITIAFVLIGSVGLYFKDLLKVSNYFAIFMAMAGFCMAGWTAFITGRANTQRQEKLNQEEEKRSLRAYLLISINMINGSDPILLTSWVFDDKWVAHMVGISTLTDSECILIYEWFNKFSYLKSISKHNNNISLNNMIMPQIAKEEAKISQNEIDTIKLLIEKLRE